MSESGRPHLSPDGRWWWDGTQWQSLVSPDGTHRWNGTSWVPIEAGPAAAPAPAPAAPARAAWEIAPPGPPAGAPAPGPPPMDLPPGPISPWIAQNYPQLRQTAAYSGVFYVGFWMRFLAYIVDGLIVGIPYFVLVVAIIIATGNATAQTTAAGSGQVNSLSLTLNLIGVIVSGAYFIYFWSTGATPGQRLFRMRVVDANTQETIGLGKAFVRYLGFLISGFCCYIGFIWAAFDSRKQGWHDKIAGTVVILASGR